MDIHTVVIPFRPEGLFLRISARVQVVPTRFKRCSGEARKKRGNQPPEPGTAKSSPERDVPRFFASTFAPARGEKNVPAGRKNHQPFSGRIHSWNGQGREGLEKGPEKGPEKGRKGGYCALLAGGGVKTRAAMSLSSISIPWPSPLIRRSLLMMSLRVSSSSTCSLTNH